MKNHFKYILEQNNKAKLDGKPLTDSEFAKIRNDMSHPSFYDAARWLTGENGKVYVHVQRGNETLHLVVMNNEHIAGGSSVYEVINQYQAAKEEADQRDRRFDVSLMINGVPIIHIELKNKSHSYMDGFRQIKKYIEEGKFRGLFSNVQMFVVSNGVDTKYFAAARANELHKEFLTGWLDSENKPVCELSDFADDVLHIPQAHEMVTKYTVLDKDYKKILILRPYQIHAIEAMREASRRGKSGFIWHTTGSGKTMTSYKSTRNLLMDIPSIDKTIFLIDRKDLDRQTTMAFQSYASEDTIDVDDTENVGVLLKRLTDGKRQMIVTTRQKMQILVTKRLKEGTKSYETIRGLKVAFVVDECHRSVTPQTKRDLERFFTRSLWYGFTGTPIFEQNSYEKKGDLAQTTEQLYGDCLHSYTIKEAIHDEAVLGFMVEYLGYKVPEEDEAAVYSSEAHMRNVLDMILNHSAAKFGLQKGRGQTYEAILTTSSIEQAQKYYDLLTRVVNGDDELKVSDEIHQALPDFPKFAITYSLSENEEASYVNQEKMKAFLDDYNRMFGTTYTLENIQIYNKNLNDRLARKRPLFQQREQQLDLVIVVDRLLTGFDAPCLSTLFIDRQPMTPQNLIQAFSRTNRLFDADKRYGQIVTFQSPEAFKQAVDEAVTMYSRGGEGKPVSEDFETVKGQFEISVHATRALGRSPEEIEALSKKQKWNFVHQFRDLDTNYAHLKAFSSFEPAMLEKSGFSQDEYEMYAGVYKNVLEELKTEIVDEPGGEAEPVDEYDLLAYKKVTIDYDYIVELLQGFIDDIGSNEAEDMAERLKAIRERVLEFSEGDPKLGALLLEVLDRMREDSSAFAGEDISVILQEMRTEAIEGEILKFARKWFISPDVVRYEAYKYRNGVMEGESQLKDSADYAAYKAAYMAASTAATAAEAAANSEAAAADTDADDAAVEPASVASKSAAGGAAGSGAGQPLPKFRYRKALIEDFKNTLMPEIEPLIRR
ncbi:MAG: HsdR family type I site-specific deoxyribonuclease [Eubacteriales bacterium]|nr:HsdR family type I site-specific deoxyribonuclease [Eubacteriales bacterium]